MGFENSGRRPQPTALTVLRGNPSKKKLNENEPCPPAGEVVKPAWLSEGARAVWEELAPICLAMRTLTVADVRAFARLCELEATAQTASASKDGRSLLTVERVDEDVADHLTVVIDAVLKLERDTSVVLRSYYELFGLTPVARARLVVPKGKPDEPVSKWAGALK